METTENSLSTLESALARSGSQKKMSLELGLSEGELSKRLAALRSSIPLLSYLGLKIVDVELDAAIRRLLKEAL